MGGGLSPHPDGGPSASAFPASTSEPEPPLESIRRPNSPALGHHHFGIHQRNRCDPELPRGSDGGRQAQALSSTASFRPGSGGAPETQACQVSSSKAQGRPSCVKPALRAVSSNCWAGGQVASLAARPPCDHDAAYEPGPLVAVNFPSGPSEPKNHGFGAFPEKHT